MAEFYCTSKSGPLQTGQRSIDEFTKITANSTSYITLVKYFYSNTPPYIPVSASL